MKINCSYCKKCDTLFDNKFIDFDGLCPECEGSLIFMVASPGVIRPTSRALDLPCTCPKSPLGFVVVKAHDCPEHGTASQ